MKLMLITSYKKNIKTKYGDKHIVSGLLYEPLDLGIVGRQHYDLWVDSKIELSPDCIGKDIYCSIGLDKKIRNIEVK